MKISKYTLLLALTLSIFSGCKDDDDDDTPTKKQILRVFVDGELQEGTSIYMFSDEREEYGQIRRQINIIANLNDYDFDFSIVNWSWQGLPNKGPKIKTYYPSDDMKRECRMDDDFNLMCEMTQVSYLRSRDTFYLTRLYDYEDNQAAITRNSENTVDGYFDVVCVTSRNDTVHLEGSFYDIEIN